MSTSSHDRWLLPRRQTEFPLRDLLPEATLHARRETTFLVLAVLALVPAAALVLTGAGHAIDLAAVLARIGIESPIAMVVPVGAAAFAVSLVAVALVCELFGRRRASAIVLAVAVSAVALAGFERIVDVVDGGAAFGAALALAAAVVVAHVVHLVVLDGMRRAARGRARFIRIVVAAFVACALGFAACGGVLWLEGGTAIAPALASSTLEAIVAIAAGAAVWSFALALVLAMVAVIVARGLGVALRVGSGLVDTRVAAHDVDDDYDAYDAYHASEAPDEVHELGRDVPRARVERAGYERPAYERAASVNERTPLARPAAIIDRVAAEPSALIERAPTERAAPLTTLPGVAPADPRAPGLAEGSVARTLPAALIVDEEVVPLEPRPRRGSLQPFSSAEMEFFREGDALE